MPDLSGKVLMTVQEFLGAVASTFNVPCFKITFWVYSTSVFSVIWQGILGTIFCRINLKCIAPVCILFLHAGPYNQTSLGGKLVSSSI